MTLFKQFTLILSLLLLSILATVMLVNFHAASNSLEERLYEDAQNTVSSLSLSLGSAHGDVSMMSTMINANFDSGNYQEIHLVDVDGKELYKRVKEIQFTDVPVWFHKLITLEAPSVSANVSAGWSQVGILSVTSDVAYAYTQLYTISKNLLISFAIIAFIGLILLNLLLAAILKPLKKVQQQAEAVTRNEFIIQEQLPFTQEFRDVVVGINTMVQKVQAMFEKGNEELKRQKELEYIDPLTKLKNRKYLIDKLPQYLKIDAEHKSGITMLISLSGVIEANEKLGHAQVDTLYQEIASLFAKHTTATQDRIIARMNGTEFMLFLAGEEIEKALLDAEAILENTKTLIQSKSLNLQQTYLSIGIYNYDYHDSIGELLSRVDNALMQSKLKEWNIHLIKSQSSQDVMGKEAWKEVIGNAIEENRFSFISWLVANTKSKKITHHVLSITLHDKEHTYSYAQFMAAANQTGLSNAIYNTILTKLFQGKDIALKDKIYSLRLPYDFLTLLPSYEKLKKTIELYANRLEFKLIIEMPDKFVNTNSELLKDYHRLFKKYNISMGIFEFIGESEDYHYLQTLRPTYIKAEASYFLSQSEQSLSALRLITDAVDIELIAVSVMDEETLAKLQKKDIFSIQGKACELIDLEN